MMAFVMFEHGVLHALYISYGVPWRARYVNVCECVGLFSFVAVVGGLAPLLEPSSFPVHVLLHQAGWTRFLQAKEELPLSGYTPWRLAP